MLCSLEYGTYIFFAFWVFVMTIYAMFFLPETKGVPIEEMAILWRKHWFWSRMTMNAEQRAAFKKGDLVGAGIGADDLNGGVPAKAGITDPKMGGNPMGTNNPAGNRGSVV
jgi:hypothetical protein